MISVLVTGSRGKSTVVRMVHRAMVGCGVKAYGRITGVIPRTLTPSGEVPIVRYSGAHVEEMRWWIGSVPSEAEGIVMENSAVSPELQPLAARWLRPSVSVITNVRPDHQDMWGDGEDNAAMALCPGIPDGGVVVVGSEVADSPLAMELLFERGCDVKVAPKPTGEVSYRSYNESLALTTCVALGMDREKSLQAISGMEPDIADFSLLRTDGGELAFAFSANDLVTTEELFRSLGWEQGRVTVLFNHRRDRPERFRVFRPWLDRPGWADRIVIGDRPLFTGKSRYVNVENHESLRELVDSAGLVFGCGNVVYGAPLDLKLFGGW